MQTDSLEVVDFIPDDGAAAFSPEHDSRRRIAGAISLVLLIVALCDVAIYRGGGFTGYAVLFAALPLMMAIQSIRMPRRASVTLIAMLGLVAAELAWCGSWLSVAAGFVLLPALALTLTGRAPYVFDTINTAVQLVPGGFLALTRYFPAAIRVRSTPRVERVAAVVIPAIAVSVFGVVFALANPDLISWISDTVTDGIRRLRTWLMDYSPGPLEVVFWCVVAWLAGGLLRLLRVTPPTQHGDSVEEVPAERLAAPLYEVHRNSLAGLVALFAAYLGYEFVTLWGREFPRGFHYSGYAHEGAAWLTLALAMATAGLSIVFAGRTLADPRLHVLRRWGYFWAIENLLLAVAVYHRLHIYIGFNGMTRMRVVGILGISAVVAGLLLVLWKIHRRRSFFWLVQRDLWTLALAMYAYCVLPVDWLTTNYNVHRIMAGDPAPSVQLSVHPLSAEGMLQLRSLLSSSDPLIREGIRAILALELRTLDTKYDPGSPRNWTEYQIAEQELRDELAGMRNELAPYGDPMARKSARDAFDTYAYQWY
jgi:hypothetical protein